MEGVINLLAMVLPLQDETFCNLQRTTSGIQMLEDVSVAEVYQMQHRLIDMFGDLHGVRDKGAVRPPFFVRKPAITIHLKRRQPR
jgi:hypothetical protein